MNDPEFQARMDALASELPDYTANGVPIKVGLRVFTNDLKLGTVTELASDGWHTVEVDGHEGYGGRFNGERMTTRHPFTYEVAK